MRHWLLAIVSLCTLGCFPDWDLLDPSNGAGTAGNGGVSSTGGGGTGGVGGTNSGVGGTTSGVGGSEGGGGMEPLGPWSDPEIVVELAHPEDDDDPSLTADGLELFFNSHRNGNGTGADIWVSKRATRDDTWGAPELVVELSSPETETNHTVSPDGLTIWFLSDRVDPTAGSEMFISTRPDRDSPWSTPVVETNLQSQNVNDVGGVTSDALMLFGHLSVMGSPDLVVLARTTTNEPWGDALPIDELNTDSGDSECWLHPNGTVVFFGSNRDGTLGSTDLWSSTRDAIDQPWGRAVNETALNTTTTDSDPTLTPDLRYILIARPVPPDGKRELFAASR